MRNKCKHGLSNKHIFTEFDEQIVLTRLPRALPQPFVLNLIVLDFGGRLQFTRLLRLSSFLKYIEVVFHLQEC